MWPFVPSQSKFAQMMTATLRASGTSGDITYDRVAFALKMRDGQVFYLNNAYADYRKASWFRRGQVLRGYAAALPQRENELPEFFDQARDHLLPRVRDRAFHAVFRLQCRAEGQTFESPPHQVFADHLTLEIVYDHPASVATIAPKTFADWKVPWADALTIARANLRRISREPFRALRPGVFQSPWQDTHDASRLILDELIGALAVKGQPVAMLPSRDCLLVTGSQDIQGLTFIAQESQKILQRETRPLSFRAFILNDRTWQPYLPPTDHPAFGPLNLLAVQGLVNDYGQQAHFLKAWYEKTGVDVFVATYAATQNEKTGRIRIWSAWTEGVPTLLPRTEWIALMKVDSERTNPKILGMARWERVVQVAGDLLVKEPDLYPERYRVEGFRTQKQLDTMDLTTELD